MRAILSILIAAAAAPAALAQDFGDTPESFVENFYEWSLGVAAVLAFGAIVYGGIKYTLAAGNPSAQSEGKDWIKSALTGLLLLFAAGIILRTINPNIFSGLEELPEVAVSDESGEPQPGADLGNCTSGGNVGTCNNCSNSPPVNSVLGCVQGQNVFANFTTFNGLHTCNQNTGSISCHFGGTNCSDGAHAIDWGKNALAAHGITLAQMKDIAEACGGNLGVPIDCRCEAGVNTVNCASGAADHLHCNVASASCSCP